MKKKADEGLKYIQKLGIRAERSYENVVNNLIKACGENEAKAYLDRIMDAQKTVISDLYAGKNSDFEKCMIFTGGYDADVVRKTCNWIDANKQYFGKNILEIGCDCGFVTCFVAMACPEASIVAIDREPDGLKIADQLAKKLGITNIEFRHCDSEDMAEAAFDTVLSVRTIQENREDLPMKAVFQPLDVQMTKYYLDVLKGYAENVAHLTVEGGRIISIERCVMDPLYLAWLKDMKAAGCGMQADSFEVIKCEELGHPCQMQAITFVKGTDCEDDAIDALWHKDYRMEMPVPGNKPGDLIAYQGWEAEAVLNRYAGELVNGFYVTTGDGMVAAKYAIYRCKDNEDVIFSYSGTGTAISMAAMDKQFLEVNETSLMGAGKDLRSKGFIIKHLVQMDGYEAAGALL